MATKIKFSFLKILFRLFSKLADFTGGWQLFVKPKLWLGTLILGIGVTACTNSAKPPTSQPTCYEPAIAPDTIEVMAECYEAVDTVSKTATSQPFLKPDEWDKDMVTCYETTAPLDTFSEEIVVTIDIPGVIGYHSGIPDVPETVYDKNKIYDVVEQMPVFPGGDAALMKFISENLKYPNTESCVEGKVILRFVVEKDGSVSNPEIIRSLDPAFDREALRIVHLMPKWIAGKQNGENVAVWFTLPITFRLK